VKSRANETHGSHVEPRSPVRNTLDPSWRLPWHRGHHSRFSTFQGSCSQEWRSSKTVTKFRGRVQITQRSIDLFFTPATSNAFSCTLPYVWGVTMRSLMGVTQSRSPVPMRARLLRDGPKGGGALTIVFYIITIHSAFVQVQLLDSHYSSIIFSNCGW